MDYYPTLVDLAGIASEKTKEQTLDGKSLVPLLHHKQELNREALFWHYPHYHQEGGVPYSAVRMGNWKLIEVFETNTFELYDLTSDISERYNISTKYPKKVTELKKVLKKWRTEVKAQYPTPNENFILNKKRNKS